eukprot:gene13463-13578_t
MSMIHLQFSPFLPIWALGLLAILVLVLVGASIWLRRALWFWRGIGLALFAGALANPLLDFEQRTPIKDVVALVLDESGSQTLAGRPAQLAQSRAALTAQLAAFPDLETRIITYKGQEDDGTVLFKAVRDGLKDISPERLAGVIMVTDGQVHDVPQTAALGFAAPLHVLLTGHAQERDRRIEGLELPKFGIVGKDVMLKLQVDDSLKDGEAGQLHLRRDGEDIGDFNAPVGRIINIPVRLDHAGANTVEIELAPVAGELTQINNRLVVTIEGVRDRVKVLLVSGAPNPGERIWRNVLKSDPNVDLVHYTILRFPNRIDDTPVSELSLIGFPMEQLFSQDIEKFDLIIFDRYANQAPLPDYYFDNIANYVRRGGALLVAVGPDFADSDGLSQTSLADILPIRPKGSVLVQPFAATLAPLGLKHPLTRDLQDPAQWAPFYRQIDAAPRAGSVLLNGAQNAPLLVVSHEDKGRVALVLTDQLWLWARGINGGGPHIELLRHISHWLLKEPALEEEALRAAVKGQNILVERQSLGETVSDIHIIAPSGTAQDVVLSQEKPGLWRAQVLAKEQGLYRLNDKTLQAFAPVGLVNSLEFANVLSGPDKLAPLTKATGGSVRRLAMTADDPVKLPQILRMRPSTSYAGSDYIGLKRNDLSNLTGLTSAPVGLGFPGLLILGGFILLIWLREAFPNGWRRQA